MKKTFLILCLVLCSCFVYGSALMPEYIYNIDNGDCVTWAPGDEYTTYPTPPGWKAISISETTKCYEIKCQHTGGTWDKNQCSNPQLEIEITNAKEQCIKEGKYWKKSTMFPNGGCDCGRPEQESIGYQYAFLEGGCRNYPPSKGEKTILAIENDLLFWGPIIIIVAIVAIATYKIGKKRKKK